METKKKNLPKMGQFLMMFRELCVLLSIVWISETLQGNGERERERGREGERKRKERKTSKKEKKIIRLDL
jgi:hypothetical protein